MNFDNREFGDNILEVGYCYSGWTEILSLPDNKKYLLKAGDVFIYKTFNKVDYFKFKHKNCKTMSIHMDFYNIKNTVNPIWEDRLILEWEQNINKIFKDNILIIEKASYDLRKIAKYIDKISTDNVMGYMKLKLKTIEFLAIFLEEKSNAEFKNIKRGYQEKINRAKEIINKNVERTPTVKELASKLDITIYKLQKGFKETTGNTVYEYIKRTRLEKAKYLLENTNMSILQISNEIGYENPSKFANLFKKYNQVTPLKYRKMKKQHKKIFRQYEISKNVPN